MWINLGTLILFVGLMLIAHRWKRMKEYLPNIFKALNIIVTYENLIYLMDKEGTMHNLGFFFGYFTALYINNQREMY